MPRKSNLGNSNSGSTSQLTLSQKVLERAKCLSLPYCSPGASGCSNLLWIWVNHKGWSKSEQGGSAMSEQENPLPDQRARLGCIWKQHQGHAWGHVLCCFHHLPAEVSPWCWLCSPAAHPLTRMLPAVGRAGLGWQLELCLWITGCLIPKAPGLQGVITMSLFG